MTALLSSSLWLAVLFIGAAVSALLGGIKKKMSWAVLSALCAIAGTLTALVSGRTLEEISSVLLALTAISLLFLTKKGANPQSENSVPEIPDEGKIHEGYGGGGEHEL